MESLLLEIGTEEIPAGYIQPALQAMSSTLLKKLDDARIQHGDARTFGTPRRLAVIVADVAAKQASVTNELTGPPERVGFDDSGNPTIPAVKFAEKVGIPVSSITVSETPRGRYLTATITEKGQATRTVLKTILPEVISAIPFPKSMKWSDMHVFFARPIQSLLALLGEKVVSFSIERIKSGRVTMGHPFMAPGKVKIQSPEQYVEALESVHVLPDIEKRRELVANTVAFVAQGLGGTVSTDEELVDIVTNLIEYPVPVAGSFDTKYLELPKEVLITAMREHQKYFAVVDDQQRLKPNFIAVNNTRARDMELVAKGHERVLRARLEDAMFFFRTDIKVNPADRVDKLKGVLFQARLGSVYEKVKRVQKLAAFLADRISTDASVKADASRAAWLCKADLVSHMVVEFPKLQGVMGRVYASRAGESDNVATAIEEHYRPVYSGAALPETEIGSLLAIADKMDSICGCFKVGLIPTGASDPYALRRQGIGIIQILQNMNFTVSLTELIEQSICLFGEDRKDAVQEVSGQVYSFLRDRIANMLFEEGFQKDVISAVTSVSVDNIPDLRKRVTALAKMKDKPDFLPLATAFKRAVNILKKTTDRLAEEVDPSLFEESCESELHTACREARQKVSAHLAEGSFDRALLTISGLRDAVDAFFDGVMVMAEDRAVRGNRLALLSEIEAMFKDIADFSKISV